MRPAFLKQHPEVGLKLVLVEAMAREAIAKNPKLAIDAYIKRQKLSPEVAKATVERECCDRGVPSFAAQVDPKSPYSMTSKDGLAAKLIMAIDALHAMGSIPARIPDKLVQDAVEPAFLIEYLKTLAK